VHRRPAAATCRPKTKATPRSCSKPCSTQDILHEQRLKDFHELQAAYASERYEQLTDHAAPINGGHCYRMDRDLDQQARQQISLEFG
jgi:hypothetical protein